MEKTKQNITFATKKFKILKDKTFLLGNITRYDTHSFFIRIFKLACLKKSYSKHIFPYFHFFPNQVSHKGPG